ncbi:MAG TPA: hypothetical protein RMH99_25530 [Sandaracinaceae bacterium LLY-WYZ-13_1]|nr:hypothetical protein [Sandaracinaceae bacterium LLY-WYZ-13_1]
MPALRSLSRPVTLAFALAACGSGPVVIDARRDGATSRPDGGVTDGGTDDAGAPDGGCEGPPPLPEWTPVDTMGPDGEGVLACIGRVGAQTDDRRPVDQAYELTTFGGPGDEQPVACAGAADADGSWYYAANGQRFACGQRIRLVDEDRSACVVVEVADVGPHACVEEAARMPIWDVSPLAAEHLFGASSVGWSEGRAVRGAPVDPDNPLGACDEHLADPNVRLRGFVGGPCDSPGDCTYADARCLDAADGWPGGACSLDCETVCPDREGPHAYTACVDLPEGRRCLARCDFTLFDDGCRDGYACERRPHPTGAGADRWVCLPAVCR